MDEERLILDRYRPLAELGRGSAGHVLLAYDTRIARRVAIKVLPLSPAQARRLGSSGGLAEARTTAMLNHPNIVTVYDWDADASNAYLVMEAVDGASLAEIMDYRGVPLEPAQVAAVVADVAEALRFAHANGVLHLDIKPENVMVTRDGIMKVTDFGVARLTDAAGSAKGIAGTPGFMAPELLRGEAVDECADVWSLGALSYLMLTGHEPYPASSVKDALVKVTGPDPRPPSRFDRSLDPAVDDIVLVALASLRDDRQHSAAAFADELLALLPDPAEGRDALAEDVERATLDVGGGEAAEREAPTGLWDVAAAFSGPLRRTAAAGASVGISWAGLTALPIPQAAAIGAAALIGVGAAVAPGLGLGLAFIVSVSGVGVQVGWVLAAGVGVALALLWWFAGGRRGAWPVVAGLYGPPLAAIRLAPVAPALFGFFMAPIAAAGASALAASLTMLGSAASGYGPPFLKIDPILVVAPWATISSHTADLPQLAQPAVLLMVLAWAGAGAAGAFIARRGGRIAGMAAVVVSVLMLGVAYGAWAILGTFNMAPQEVVMQLGFALFIALAIALVGPPPHLEPDGKLLEDEFEAEEAEG